jgi:hypothetical protein
MSDMDDQPKPKRHYRVVGIRQNGTRAVMNGGLSVDEAKRIRNALVEADIFEQVQVEMDSGDPPD